MASTDARPVPLKNTAYRHYFCIRKNDGTIITSWDTPDSELSLDGGTMSDATNEAMEIATNSGCGYIDLTAPEMDYDSVVLKVTVANTDAVPYVVTFFPEEAGDIRANVTEWNDVALATTNPLPNAAANAAGGLLISTAGSLDMDAMNTNINDIETDTSTTLPATLTTIESKIDTVDTEVGLVLEDTGTTLPGTLTTMDGKLDTIDTEVGDILADTADMQPKLGTITDLGGGATVAANLSSMAGATFSSSNDSLDAIREHIGDGTNLTEAGGTGDHLTAIIGTGADTLETLSAQIDSIGASSGGSLNFEADTDNTGGALKGATFAGTQTGTFANTETEDGSYHQITAATNDIDIVYGFSVGGARTSVELTWKGYLSGGNDDAIIQAYDFGATGWDTIATVAGQSGTTNITINAPLLSKHTGTTGADIGKVYIRIDGENNDSAPVLYTDLILVAAVNVGQSVGYSNGAFWIDDSGTSGTEVYVNGTADNPCPFADAITMNATLPLNRFRFVPGSSATLTAAADAFEMVGSYWDLDLSGQSIDGMYVSGATVVGIGEATTAEPTFRDCLIGAATIPPARLIRCGIGHNSGQFTAAADAGDYVLENCYSKVAGAGAPALNFASVTGATTINTRGWLGGATYTLDSGANCTLSHEVLAGGGTTITTGGGNCEVRGTPRSLTVEMSGTETVQFVGTTGPITLSGSTTGTVNLHGISTSLSDTTTATGATVNDNTVRRSNQDAIEADTQDLQTQVGTAGDGLTDLGGMSTAMKAEVQTEAEEALATYNLDHLLAVADADDVVDNSVIAKLASKGATADWSTFVNTTDSLQGIREEGDASWGSAGANPNVLLTSEISSVTDQTTLVLVDGATFNDAYNDQAIVIYDDSNSDYPSVRVVTAYNGTTKTVTLDSAPDFTVGDDDSVRIFATAPGTSAPTAAQVADAVWDEAQVDHATPGTFGEIATETAAILVDTAEIGTAGDGLTAVPWNASWDAEVESEVTEALTAYNAVATTDLPAHFGDLAITVTTGQVTVGTNNDKTGYSISGTITTLDALDTEQDTQHTTTRASIDDLNDVAATDIVSNGAITTLSGAVVNVDTVDSVTALASNSITSSVIALNAIDSNGLATSAVNEIATGVTTDMDANSTQLAAIAADTGELQGDWADNGRLDLILDARASQASVDALPSAADVLTTAMTESYGTDGAAVTLAEACYVIMQGINEFAISGTTKTVKKLDGSTTAYTSTLDDATSPTSITRAT
jgi:hypothetical protein